MNIPSYLTGAFCLIVFGYVIGFVAGGEAFFNRAAVASDEALVFYLPNNTPQLQDAVKNVEKICGQSKQGVVKFELHAKETVKLEYYCVPLLGYPKPY